MPWPPQVHDLDKTEIKMTDYLHLFLNKPFPGCSNESISRLNRLRLSLGQDLDYGISNGCIKTPKSISYPYAIKILARSTKVSTINNQLSHGISASILEKLVTENAFRFLNNRESVR